MTPTPADNPEDSLMAIIISHPIPKELKSDAHLRRIESMRDYYHQRYQAADDDRKRLFVNIDNTLAYSATMIKLYRQLTTRLSGLSEKKDGLDEPK